MKREGRRFDFVRDFKREPGFFFIWNQAGGKRVVSGGGVEQIVFNNLLKVYLGIASAENCIEIRKSFLFKLLKTKAELLAAAGLDVYLSHHAPLLLLIERPARRKECSVHLSYGSLPQRSFTTSASSTIELLFIDHSFNYTSV
ncbi:hypothetical protein QYF36_005102 [Acer negundo]|nr:hypothetical protein QYF36_005102 [Acer negundo]